MTRRGRGLGRCCTGLAGLGRFGPFVSARIYIGLGRADLDDPLRVVDPERAAAFVRETVRQLFPYGSTHHVARGTYRDDEGEFTAEPNLIVEVLIPTDTTEGERGGTFRLLRGLATWAARLFARVFGQRSVMVQLFDGHGRPEVDFVSCKSASAGDILRKRIRGAPPGAHTAIAALSRSLLPRGAITKACRV